MKKETNKQTSTVLFSLPFHRSILNVVENLMDIRHRAQTNPARVVVSRWYNSSSPVLVPK